MAINIIQMAASAVHAVAYTIGPIFKHIIDCVQLYFRLIMENNFIQMAASAGYAVAQWPRLSAAVFHQWLH